MAGLLFFLCSDIDRAVPPSFMSSRRVSHPEPGLSMLDCRFLNGFSSRFEHRYHQDCMFLSELPNNDGDGEASGAF